MYIQSLSEHSDLYLAIQRQRLLELAADLVRLPEDLSPSLTEGHNGLPGGVPDLLHFRLTQTGNLVNAGRPIEMFEGQTGRSLKFGVSVR